MLRLFLLGLLFQMALVCQKATDQFPPTIDRFVSWRAIDWHKFVELCSCENPVFIQKSWNWKRSLLSSFSNSLYPLPVLIPAATCASKSSIDENFFTIGWQIVHRSELSGIDLEVSPLASIRLGDESREFLGCCCISADKLFYITVNI